MVKKLLYAWQRLWCTLGVHGWDRTEHFGERKCVTCGGSHWGRVVYGRNERYLGAFKWYSAKKLRAIEAAGEMQDLINGTGRFEEET